MMIKIVVLLLLVTMPSQVICGLHQVAEFNCQFKPIGYYIITWTVNVSSGIKKGESGITTTLENQILHLNI